MTRRLATNIWNTVGFYIVILYVFFTYIPQLAIHKIFYEDFLILYRGSDAPGILVVLTIICFFFSVILVDNVMPRVSIHIRQDNLKYIGSFISTFLIIIYLLTAIYFYKHFGVDFRQTKRLNDAGIIVKILWFVRMYGEFYVFYIFVSVLNGLKIKLLQKIKLFIVLISWILSITGSLNFLLVIVGFILLVSSNKYLKKLFFKNKKHKISFFTYGIIAVFALSMIVAAIFIGFSNKIGFDNTIEMFTNTTLLHKAISHIFLRLSTSYTAVLYMSRDYILDIPLQLDIYMEGLDTFLNRLSSLLPFFDYPLNEIRSVNRTNYLLLFIPNYLPVAGATPGLLASIYYIPTFPFNFILMGLFVVLIVRSTNRYIQCPAKTLSLFSKVLLLIFIFPLFESPLNMLSIIEPSVFYFILFIIMSYFPPKRIMP